jgi:ABC-type bacteriocin/lantibiotic exporter with double-glycine peptidase domain
VKLVVQRGAKDCCVAALACFLEVSYEDAYVAVTAIEGKRRGKNGLNFAQLIEAARAFGVTLRHKRHPVLDDDEGILCVNFARSVHAVVLAYGVIADPADGLVLPADDYLVREKARAGSLLEVA